MKIKVYINSIYVFLFVAMLFLNCSKENNELMLIDDEVSQNEPITPLKEKATTFLVGVSVSSSKLNEGNNYDKIINSPIFIQTQQLVL